MLHVVTTRIIASSITVVAVVRRPVKRAVFSRAIEGEGGRQEGEGEGDSGEMHREEGDVGYVCVRW
jgi:hypothetical protein